MTTKKSFKILPVQIVEEVIRTTVDGTVKTYMLKFPDKKGTVVDISDVKAELFTTPSAIKSYMLGNAERAIDDLLVKAHELRSASFEEILEEPQEQHHTQELADDNEDVNGHQLTLPGLDRELEAIQNQDEGIINVDLGNGVMAKMDVETLSKVGGGI
jgi:hypothetical protein